jgi:integrase
MSVRKHEWVTRKGEERAAWLVDYTDGAGVRRAKFFQRKKDADAYHASVRVEVAQGIHTPPSRSITVSAAAADWLKYVELEKREVATIAGYRTYFEKHITPRLGAAKLSSLTTPRIEKFRDNLLEGGASRYLAKKVLGALKAILKDAKRRGNVAQNVAADVRIDTHSRNREKLKIGRDIPSRDEIRRILEAAPEGRTRALIMTAAFSGLRASELRGLRWEGVDLKHNAIHVRQRADRYNTIGRPKSAAGERTVPIPSMVANALRHWQLASSSSGLVFGTRNGAPDGLSNIVNRIWMPLQIKAGVVRADGKAKYPGLHSLRHFYASWCINRRKDGGLELPAKTVQTRLGHASIVLTLDRYGHLFPSDDGAELDQAVAAIFAT